MSTFSAQKLGGLASELGGAAERLRAGRTIEAHATLSALVAARPLVPEARHLLGLACERLGDLAAAEQQLRTAISLDRNKPAYPAALGELLAGMGRAKEAERNLRAALALDRCFGPAVERLAELLSADGRSAEALLVTSPLVSGGVASESVLSAHATALRGLERDEEALTSYRRAAVAFPNSALAEHNVAAVAGDLARHEEAETAARAAFAKGGDAPETWLVLGRALEGQSRFDAAKDAYQQALRRRPTSLEAHRKLAELIWMESEDLATASVELDAAIAKNPAINALRLLKSSLAYYAGDAEESYAVLASGRIDNDPRAQIAASRVALRTNPLLALRHAEAAATALPERDAEVAVCEALLAVGRAGEAATLLERLHSQIPNDQQVLACMATAWRLTGDPRYSSLYDCQTFVRCSRINTPPGWASLHAYLAQLADSLSSLHPLRGHPIGQSLRSGTQTRHDLRTSVDPTISSLFEALDAPIRAHIHALGSGTTP